METTIVADNTKGQVLAFDGEEQVGQLEFTFKGQVMCIDHTQAFKKGMGIGALLVEAANRMSSENKGQVHLDFVESRMRKTNVNEYAINHKLKVLPICSYAYAWYQRHPQYKDILDEHAGEGVSCQL